MQCCGVGKPQTGAVLLFSPALHDQLMASMQQIQMKKKTEALQRAEEGAATELEATAAKLKVQVSR